MEASCPKPRNWMCKIPTEPEGGPAIATTQRSFQRSNAARTAAGAGRLGPSSLPDSIYVGLSFRCPAVEADRPVDRYRRRDRQSNSPASLQSC